MVWREADPGKLSLPRVPIVRPEMQRSQVAKSAGPVSGRAQTIAE
jgi:hypothetical protein